MGWGADPSVRRWPRGRRSACELLMLVIRGSQAAPGGMSSSADNPDPLDDEPSGCGTTSLQGLRVGREVPLRKPLARSVSSHGRASRATAAFLMMII